MKALIVDDDMMSFLIAQALLSNMSFSSHHAKTSEESLSYLKENQVDVILMDLGLPDIDGFQISQQIKSLNEAHRSIPIIAVSGTLNEQVHAKVTEYELLGPLQKPLDKQLVHGLLLELDLVSDKAQ